MTLSSHSSSPLRRTKCSTTHNAKTHVSRIIHRVGSKAAKCRLIHSYLQQRRLYSSPLSATSTSSSAMITSPTRSPTRRLLVRDSPTHKEMVACRRITTRNIFKLDIGCSYKSKVGTQDPVTGDVLKSGEDALFVSSKTDCIGVFDGVGGWVFVGVDPSAVSYGLMQNVKNFAETNPEDEPSKLLCLGYDALVKDTSVFAGSTTACVLKLKNSKSPFGKKKTAELHYANLGDSGFMVIRDGQLYFKSELQQHLEFNTPNPPPYQLAIVPESLKHLKAMEDQPEVALTGIVDVRQDDLIILGTDGLFDNMTYEEICCKVADLSQQYSSSADNQTVSYSTYIARNLVTTSFTNNRKPDDISIVVARVNLSRNTSQNTDTISSPTRNNTPSSGPSSPVDM